MSNFQIIVGSMLGGSEYVAEACQAEIEARGDTTTLHLVPKLADISYKNQTWLICTSTHGAGDYPDNIKDFVIDLEKTDQDLSTTSFIIIGIGDSNYDTFCFAAKNIENLLLSKGLKALSAAKLYDMQQALDPEEDAPQWISTLLDQTK